MCGTREAELTQRSDHNDAGASCRKEKSGQSPSEFTKLFSQRLYEDQKAFQEEYSLMTPSQGSKIKEKVLISGRKQSTLHLSSREEPFRCPRRLVDKKKQRIPTGDKYAYRPVTSSRHWLFSSKSRSFYKARAPQDQPSTKPRPTHRSTYGLVDEVPLPSDTKQYSEQSSDCMKDIKVYYPSRDAQDSVEVDHTDMRCLAPEAYLSSTIMNFYIRYLQQMATSSENVTCKYHFFNTYFYNKLQKLSYSEDSFLKFRKWWKGVNISMKKLTYFFQYMKNLIGAW